jgi:hypothetical protein
MVIEYTDRVFDIKAPVSGLCIKTFKCWHKEEPIPMIYYKLRQKELIVLQPGTFIRIANLTFIVERFNTGVVAKLGNRTKMEDCYFICQDIGFDSIMKVSSFTVIDGHGGE